MYLFYMLGTVLEDDQALTKRSPEQPVVGAPALSWGLGWVISSLNCSVVLFSSFMYIHTHIQMSINVCICVKLYVKRLIFIYDREQTHSSRRTD